MDVSEEPAAFILRVFKVGFVNASVIHRTKMLIIEDLRERDREICL